jgi:DNA repair ATPase RecN
MRKAFLPILFISIAFISCSSDSPQDYFNKAVLNTNLLYGFAGYELKRDLATPSEKLVDEKTLATAPMKRAEVVKNKLDMIEKNFENLKDLKPTDDSKEMLNASIALYEFVMPVYKNEYQQLANLYDNGEASEKIATAEKNITDRYEAKFLSLYQLVGDAGKQYAAKHGIRVLEVNPSPSLK